MLLRCSSLARRLRPIGLALVFALPGLVAAQDNARPIKAKAAPEKPITDGEAQAVADAVTQAVAASDTTALDGQINWPALYGRVTNGVDAPDGIRKAFVAGLEQTRTNGQGLAGSIVAQIQKGGTYTLLRVHETGPRRRVLFRLTPADGGMNYHDFLLARQPDGKVQIEDVYIFLSGETFTRTIRRFYLMSIAQATKTRSLLDRLVGEDQKYVKFFEDFDKMNKARQAGDNKQVVALSKALPPDLRKDKSILLARLMAAQQVDNAEYQQALEEFRAAYPNDACIDMVSIDHFLLKKQYREALACLDRVDKAVGGDPFLGTMRANVYGEMNDFPAARLAVAQALKAEPTLTDAYWSLVTIALKEKNHAEVLKNLRLIRDRFGVTVGDLTTVPVYADFVKSPEYQTWLKESQKPPAAEQSKPAATTKD